MWAFVIRPFGEKTDSAGATIDFEKVHTELIAPALKAAGLEGGTTGQIIDAGNIREDMFAMIIQADLVVADVTVHNANVFYEAGIAHTLGREVVLISQSAADVPFDLRHHRYLTYMANSEGLADLRETLLSRLTTLMAR